MTTRKAGDISLSEGPNRETAALELDVHAIIIAYNSAAIIGDCLASAVAQGIRAVTVWDNASTDIEQLRAVVRAFGEPVRLVESTENLGFARAVNRAAAGTETRLTLLLNPDCIMPDTGTIAAMAAYLDGRPDFCAVVPAVVNALGEPLVAGGAFPSISKELVAQSGLDARLSHRAKKRIATVLRLIPGGRRLSLQISSMAPRSDIELEWVSGFCLLMRTEAWVRAGGFDPDFFLYFEDVALSREFRRMGKRVGVVAAPTVIHDESSSSRNHGKSMHYRQAMRVYFRKYGSPAQRFWARLIWRGVL